MTEVDTSWIKPGAEVVVYATGGNPNPKRTTVDRVAAQSFTLVGITERIKLETLQSKRIGGDWHRWNYVVVRPDSPKAKELFRQRRIENLGTNAWSAVDAWNKGGSREDLAKIDAAIEALQKYRSVLSDDSASSQSMDGRAEK